MKLSLQVLSQGSAYGTKIPVSLAQFVIGRDPQCHLRPASPLISKRHCALLVKAGKVFLRDFGSTNGTYVNDEPVKGERQLKANDLLKVGPLIFRLLVEGVPVDKPTPPPPQARPAPEASGDDESIAAMLLSLQEEGGDAEPVGGGSVKAEDIPAGTTVMDIPTMPPESPPPGAPAKQEPPKKPKESASSSSAAAALLAKYSRRPRS